MLIHPGKPKDKLYILAFDLLKKDEIYFRFRFG